MATQFPIPLNALHALEVVARTGALAPAAEELGVTPGAVSQHIRRAEERLDLQLFHRTASGLVPTEVLHDVLPRLREGFAALADVGAALKRGKDCTLTLSVGNVFASRWLVWRMAKFSARHPEIELRLVVTGQMADLSRPDVDCGIRFGAGEWAGARAELIGGSTYQPVCAPPVAELLKSPEDISNVPVIRDEGSMLSWPVWWEAAGVSEPPKMTGPVFSDPALAFDAAVSEQGVLMAVDMMSADMVSDGRLVRPFKCEASNDTGYWLVTDKDRSMPDKVRVFRDWLLEEIPLSSCGYVGQLRGQQERHVSVTTRPKSD